MSSVGFIKLHRRLKDSDVFADSELFHIFSFCLLEAEWETTVKPVGNNVITLSPGQFITGRKKISRITGVKESKIYRCLNLLEKLNIIEQQKTTKYSIISIVNWSKYQHTEQQTDNKSTTDEQQENTVKEVKKKEEKKEEDCGEFLKRLITLHQNKCGLATRPPTDSFKRWIDAEVTEEFIVTTYERFSAYSFGSRPKAVIDCIDSHIYNKTLKPKPAAPSANKMANGIDDDQLAELKRMQEEGLV